MKWSPHASTLRQLQYAAAVAELRSFRKAAERCRVSQPSLSSQVAQLEESLGVRLFERDRRGVVLTHAGVELIERARQVLAGAEELEEAARRRADPLAGELSLGVIPTVAPYLLPEVAGPLRARFEKMTIWWREEKTPSIMAMLARAELDGAVVALEASLGEVERVVLGDDPFVLAVGPGHPLSRSKKTVRVDDLSGHSMLLLDDGHCLRDQALSFCSRVGVEEQGFRATSLSTLTQVAAGTGGATLLPMLSVPVENRLGGLCIRKFWGKGPSRTLALVWRRRSAAAAAMGAVGKALRELYQRLSARIERQAGGLAPQ